MCHSGREHAYHIHFRFMVGDKSIALTGGTSDAMTGMKVSIVRYISDDPQPGIVECQFEDAYGRRWSFVEKTLVVSPEQLDEHTVYPQPGVTACNIVQQFADATGREVIRINTVESLEGVTQFDVLPESLVELNW